MTKRFLIQPRIKRTPLERQAYWEHVHAETGYSTIWSMTEDSAARKKLIDTLTSLPRAKRILVPGCGSRTVLQHEIADAIPSSIEVGCCDFPEVISLAKANTNHPKITYYERDISSLTWENEWDAVVAVNCVLSHDDLENREILASFYRSLRADGYLIGYFPTIFALLDIGHLEKGPVGSQLLERLDLPHSTTDEGEQGGSQVLYTPLRLRHILREAGFILETMEIYFCDTPYFINETAKQYNFGDEDIVIYELFVVARKG